MINVEHFRAESHRQLEAFLRVTAPELRERAAVLSAEIRDELRSDLTTVRPRRALMHLDQMMARQASFSERADLPDTLRNFHAQQLGELVGWLERLEPMGGRRFFEPEPVTAFTVAGWTVSYVPWDEEALPWPDADPPFEEAFLEFLAAHPALWEQQRPLLSRTSLSAMTLWSLEDPEQPTSPEARGSVSPQQLLSFRKVEMKNGGSGWGGVNGLPFLMGRITALLGRPPETHGPGALVAVSRGTTERHQLGVDDSLMLFSNHPQRGAAAAEALTSALLSSTAVADVERILSQRSDSYRLGVQGGRLFCEDLPFDRCPPWFRSS